MSRMVPEKLSGIVIGGSLVLTGCAGGSSAGADITGAAPPSSSFSLEKSPPVSVAATPSPSITPTAAVSSSALTQSGLAGLKDSWTTKDGYKYSLTIDDFEQAAVPDLANAKPGEVNVTATYKVVADVANDTPGRNADWPAVNISPAWKKGSVVCEALKQQGVDVAAFESQAGDPGYCNLGGMKGFVGSEDRIPAQGNMLMSVEFKAELSFDEAATKEALGSLAVPDFWFLTRPEGDTNTTACTIAGEHVSAASQPIPCPPIS